MSVKDMIDNNVDYQTIISYSYNNEISDGDCYILIMYILSNNKENKSEEHFLHFYKQKHNVTDFLNYSSFGMFVQINWINAAKYFIENVNFILLSDEYASQGEVPFFKQACDKNRIEIVKMLLENKKEVMNFYNSQTHIYDHLGFAYDRKQYELCNILIKYNKFLITFDFFFEPTNNQTFEQAVNKIKNMAIQSKFKTF